MSDPEGGRAHRWLRRRRTPATADPGAAGHRTGANGSNVLAGAEIYDPATGRFGAAAALPGPRSMHGATLLADGRVLLAGGRSARGTLLDRVVIAGGYGVDTYADGALRALGTVPGPERQFPAAAALPDGRVLITGGYDNRTDLTATAVVVQP